MKALAVVTILAILFVSVSIGTTHAQQKYDIPSWVKGVAGFWAEGNISDDDFGEGISFLIEEKILTVPIIASLEEKIIELESDNENLRAQLGQSYTCDASYPDVCIPEYPPDLNCGDIMYANFKVLQPDPHGFDRDRDGIGCQS